ncbi:MAG: NAD(P)-binding domain-containing protein [Myxococcaceae bacterium]
MARIAVLGSGMVGETLANGFLKDGHDVMRASRDLTKLHSWKKHAGAKAQIGHFDQACDFGELLVLSVKGSAAESVVRQCGSRLRGKTIIDTTNPISDEPADNGVLRFFTGPNDSLMERLQTLSPKANFVKAFNSIGYAHMVQPQFGATKPTMFICGNSNVSKNTVREILLKWGWDVEDMGLVESARALEPLCQLWCIPGFTKNQWNHAFKLLKI